MYSCYLNKFLDHHKVTAEESLFWSADEAEDRMEEWKDHLIESEYSGSTIRGNYAILKKWFKDHKIRVDITCSNVDTGKTYLDYLPTREDVRKLLDDAKLNHMVGIALIAFSGLRPVDVVRLRYENIKASFEAGDEVLTIIVKQKKTRDWYFTFLGPQGTRYLKQLLEYKKTRGEVIDDNTQLLPFAGETLSSSILRKAITRIIARTVGKHPTGESFRVFRPYGLRKYFRRTINKLGESEAEFLMGHRKGLESLVATYSGLRDMDPQAIAALKKKYVALLPELETEVSDVTLKVQIANMEETQKTRQVELAELKEDVIEIREFLQQLKEQEEG